MSRKQAQPTFLLGTAVKITTTLNVDSATSAKITILDASLNTKVDAANMTNSANKVYTYVYQSASSDEHGVYVARIAIVSGGYTTITEEDFAFIKQTGT